MQAMAEQADITIKNIRNMLKLRETYENNLDKIHASKNTYKLLDNLFEKIIICPYITTGRSKAFGTNNYYLLHIHRQNTQFKQII